MHEFDREYVVHIRAVARSENLEVPVLFDGHNLSPLVEIGLTDLPKSGCTMAHPAVGTPREDRPVTKKYHYQTQY